MGLPQKIASYLTRSGWRPGVIRTGSRPKLDDVYPTFAKYRQRSSRTIDVVELSPLSP